MLGRKEGGFSPASQQHRERRVTLGSAEPGPAPPPTRPCKHWVGIPCLSGTGLSFKFIYIWFVVDEPKELQTEQEPRRSVALLHSAKPSEISTSCIAHVLVEEKVFSPSKRPGRVGAVSALCKVLTSPGHCLPLLVWEPGLFLKLLRAGSQHSFFPMTD